MFDMMIREICLELDIKYKKISKDWVTMLEKDGVVKYIVGNKFDLNPHGIGLVMDDKYAFYDLLKNIDIEGVVHHIFYKPGNKYKYAIDCNKYEDIYRLYYEYGRDIVVKVNDGSLGIDVYRVRDRLELDKILDRLFIKNYSISICPYYDIKYEYRVIVLDKEIKFIYKKIRPIVYGDGVSSLKELLDRFNYSYFKDKDIDDIILDKDREYVYDWKFNLSRGSIGSIEIDVDIRKKLEDIVRKVIDRSGIVFASIDIIETKDNRLLVMEANSGVTFDKIVNYIDNGYIVGKNIYKDGIKKMFNIDL